MLRLAAVLVPRRSRQDWIAEWWAELCWFQAEPRRTGDASLVAAVDLFRRTTGSIPDALALRGVWLGRKLARNRVALSRLARSPLCTATAAGARAIPMVLSAAAFATVAHAASTAVDMSLLWGAAVFGFAALLLAVVSASTPLFPETNRTTRAMLVSLAAALAVPGAMLAARWLCDAVGFVSQDVLGPPQPGEVAMFALALGSVVVAVSLRRTGRGPERDRSRSARKAIGTGLIAVAGATLLLLAVALLYRDRDARSIELGFDPTDLDVVRVQLEPEAGAGADELVRALSQLPGVLGATATTLGPLSRDGNELTMVSLPADGVEPFVSVARGIGPEYFSVLGAPAVPEVSGGDVLVNGTLARRLGTGVRDGAVVEVDGRSVVIAGLAPDIQYFDPEDPIAPVLYYPLPGSARLFDLIVRRESGGPSDPASMRNAVRTAAPGADVIRVGPLTNVRRSRLAWREFAALLMACLGLSCEGLALLRGLARRRMTGACASIPTRIA